MEFHRTSIDKLISIIEEVFDSNEIILSCDDVNYEIIVTDNDDSQLCGIILFNSKDLKMHLYKLKKCSISGTEFLLKMDELAEKLNIKSITLTDESSIEFGRGRSINLALLNILSTGKSWYNSKGYISTNYIDEQEHNLKIIDMNICEFLLGINFPEACTCSVSEITHLYKPNVDVKTFFTNIKELLKKGPSPELKDWLISFFRSLRRSSSDYKPEYYTRLTKIFIPDSIAIASKRGGKKRKYTKKKGRNKKRPLPLSRRRK